MTAGIKELARIAVAAADGYLRGSLGPQALHDAAEHLMCGFNSDAGTLMIASHQVRLLEALKIIRLAMERTSERGGTHEVRWRNVMHTMAMVVRMELGEGLHPEDAKTAPRVRVSPEMAATLAEMDFPPGRLEVTPASEPAPSNVLQLLLTVAQVLRSQYGPPAPLMSSPECRALLDARMAPFEARMEAEHG